MILLLFSILPATYWANDTMFRESPTGVWGPGAEIYMDLTITYSFDVFIGLLGILNWVFGKDDRAFRLLHQEIPQIFVLCIS